MSATGTGKTTAKNLEDRFDAGEDVTDYFDMDHPVMINKPDSRRLSLDMPDPQVRRLDKLAARIGVSRKALINIACEQLLEREDEAAARRLALSA